MQSQPTYKYPNEIRLKARQELFEIEQQIRQLQGQPSWETPNTTRSVEALEKSAELNKQRDFWNEVNEAIVQ